MSMLEKQREKVARLRAEKQKTAKEAAVTLAAHTDFLTADDLEEGAFGSAKAAALLRKAGEARERDDAMAPALAHAEQQLVQLEREEEKRVRALRWKEAEGYSGDRLTEAKAMAALLAQIAIVYPRFVAANERLVNSLPNSATVDRDAGYLRPEQLSAAVRIELARLGAGFVAAIDQPHLVESLAERFSRADKWIRSFSTEA
jgi:hypothetical protein